MINGLVPKRMFLTKGVGRHKFKLKSFEDALRDAGRRKDTPVTLVRRARDEARDARRWYEALLQVRYPLSTKTRNRVDKQIEYMKEIISACRRWTTRATKPLGAN